MELAEPVLNRMDDSRGEVGDVFRQSDSAAQATTLTDDDALRAVLTAELVKHRMAKEAEKAKAAAAER